MESYSSAESFYNKAVTTQGWSPGNVTNQDDLKLTEIQVEIKYADQVI